MSTQACKCGLEGLLRGVCFFASVISVLKQENEWVSNFFCRKKRSCSMQCSMNCSTSAVPRERSMHTSSLYVDAVKHPFHPTIHCSNCIFNFFPCLQYYFYMFWFSLAFAQTQRQLGVGDFGSGAVGFYFEKVLKFCLAASLDSSEQLVESTLPKLVI